jgi:raffinose/stachyose/melibiose transport system permease protein
VRSIGALGRRSGDAQGPVALRRREQVLFLLPAFALLLTFYILPNLLNFAVAATNWSTFSSTVRFVGLDNFAGMMESGRLWATVGRTVVFAVAVTLVVNVVALGLALALERPTRVNMLFRALFFLPVLISSLSAGYVARGLLDPAGTVNQGISAVTSALGLGSFSYGWLGDRTLVLFIIAVVHAWKWGGIVMLVYITGLTAVPRDLLDAGRVDGATSSQLVRFVKLPLLGPALTFNLTLSLIGALAAFDLMLAMTRGGPARASEVINYDVWKAFGTGYFGESSALSLVLFVLSVLFAIPLIISLRRREVRL